MVRGLRVAVKGFVVKMAVAVCLLAISSQQVFCASDTLGDIDSMAQEALQEWGIPGMAIAIVCKGKDIAVKGYGEKERGKAHAVDSETLFQIASLSKAFTAAAIGMLVEQEKLQWEAPIKKELPTFNVKDPIAKNEMTLRDLLTHRTGLPGTAMQCWRLWYHTDRPFDDLVRRLSYVDPAFPFRSHFSYNNVAYAIAGSVAEHASEMPLQRFYEERIFRPLGMSRTHVSYSSLVNDSNVASPHLERFLHEQPIPWSNWEPLAAAGGINSCAKDMALWMKYCLSEPEPLKQSFQPQTIMEAGGFLDALTMPSWPIYVHDQEIVAYGFGWAMFSLGGRKILLHPGLCDGMQSICALVPEEGLGITILTNQEGHLGASCMLNVLLDRFLNLPPVAWHQRGHKAIREIGLLVRTARIQLEETHLQRAPSLPESSYIGQYEHPAYGSILVRLENGRLAIELWTHEKGILKPWDKDRFEIVGFPARSPLPLLIDFKVNQQNGEVAGLLFPDLGVFQVQKTEKSTPRH